MDKFQEALEDCALHDLGFEGDVFTWRNNSHDSKYYIRALRQTVSLPSAWVFAERYLSGARQRPPLPSAGLSAKNALGNDSFA
jgi:hypothetical protein